MASKAKSAEQGKAEVEAYLAGVSEPARTTLEKMRATIRAAAPAEATEAISYGIPSFQYKGGLVAYAAFKNHCSFFPMGSSAIEEFAEELKGYRVSKGTIHFPIDTPLPAGLVRKMVRACVRRNSAKTGKAAV
ncbi:MAG: DUF1801 domain-containing protein [Terracidiphilus sp.]|jgi:uncharacterized protein YdhG (YjbR/CyaY superfamily)